MEGFWKVFVWLGTMLILQRFGMSLSDSHTVEWSPNINYTERYSHEQFYVGDYLGFVSNNSNYNIVLEVNKTNYENCIDENFTTNISERRLDMFKLMEAKPYYFIAAGKDYCVHGMKLIVYVQAGITPNAQPSPTVKHDSSPSIAYRWIAFLVLVAIVATYICIHKFRRRKC